jgi:hypothetical protein
MTSALRPATAATRCARRGLLASVAAQPSGSPSPPALVRIADQLPMERLAAHHEEHTPSGAHRTTGVPFPDGVPDEVQTEAERLTVDAAFAHPSRTFPKIQSTRDRDRPYRRYRDRHLTDSAVGPPMVRVAVKV